MTPANIITFLEAAIKASHSYELCDTGSRAPARPSINGTTLVQHINMLIMVLNMEEK
jgi:hypothetical protein